MRLLFAVCLFLLIATPALARDDAYDSGYEWAQENGYTEARDCGTDSNPFNEGCEAWGDEYQKGYDEAESEDYTDEDDCLGTDAERAGCEARIIESK